MILFGIYGTVDETTKVANSFTELITRIIHAKGQGFFWVEGHNGYINPQLPDLSVGEKD